MVFAIHQHESVLGVHMSSSPQAHIPPHPTLLGCHRILALGSLLHTWLSILHMVIYMFQCYSHIIPSPSPTVQKVCVSIAALQVGSSVLSF